MDVLCINIGKKLKGNMVSLHTQYRLESNIINSKSVSLSESVIKINSGFKGLNNHGGLSLLDLVLVGIHSNNPWFKVCNLVLRNKDVSLDKTCYLE